MSEEADDQQWVESAYRSKQMKEAGFLLFVFSLLHNITLRQLDRIR